MPIDSASAIDCLTQCMLNCKSVKVFFIIGEKMYCRWESGNIMPYN